MMATGVKESVGVVPERGGRPAQPIPGKHEIVTMTLKASAVMEQFNTYLSAKL
jgi:hypothetical protein